MKCLESSVLMSWAMLFGKSHPKATPSGVPRQNWSLYANPKLPTSSSIMPRLTGQSYLSSLTHNMIIHSLQRKWNQWLPCLLTSKTLSHPFLIPSIQTPHPFDVPEVNLTHLLRHVACSHFSEIILSLHLKLHPYFPLLGSMTFILSLEIITLSKLLKPIRRGFPKTKGENKSGGKIR